MVLDWLRGRSEAGCAEAAQGTSVGQWLSPRTGRIHRAGATYRRQLHSVDGNAAAPVGNCECVSLAKVGGHAYSRGIGEAGIIPVARAEGLIRRWQCANHAHQRGRRNLAAAEPIIHGRIATFDRATMAAT